MVAVAPDGRPRTAGDEEHHVAAPGGASHLPPPRHHAQGRQAWCEYALCFQRRFQGWFFLLPAVLLPDDVARLNFLSRNDTSTIRPGNS